VALTSWYDHLDVLATALGVLRDAGKLPECKIEVTPAPPLPDDVARMSKRMLSQVFLSIGGMADQNQAANYPVGDLSLVASIYTRDGHTAEQGEKIERNRLAAIIAEQLHVLLRDPGAFQLDAPALRSIQMNNTSDRITALNLSYQGGEKAPDRHQLAYWSVQWQPRIQSEPMNPTSLADLAQITIAVSGAELGGDNPDAGDDLGTEVDFA
jgi:hypothetical protein